MSTSSLSTPSTTERWRRWFLLWFSVFFLFYNCKCTRRTDIKHDDHFDQVHLDHNDHNDHNDHFDQVHLPLTEFAAFFRGQQVEDAPPLDLTKVIKRRFLSKSKFNYAYLYFIFPNNSIDMPHHFRLELLASRPLAEFTTILSSLGLELLRLTPFPYTDPLFSVWTIHLANMKNIYSNIHMLQI